MNIKAALVLAIIFFVLFSIISYFGAKITLLSSIVLGLLVSIILLNVLYSPGELANTEAGVALVLYILFEFTVIIIISFYVVYKSLNDLR